MPSKKNDSLSLAALLLLLALSLGLGISYRWAGLEARPLHTDEAILATKLASLWNGQGFDYDPSDYHGPGLHYVSWLQGKVLGWGPSADWTATQLRQVCAVCGLGVMLCSLLFVPALGSRAAVLALLMIAVSPMMVFYSRYFIMEMLLVLLVALSLAALWRWSVTRNRFWLLVCGASLGFQHATKETFVLNVGAAALAWLAASWLISDTSRGGPLRLSEARRPRKPSRPLYQVAATAALVSVACYSGGFTEWSDVRESVTTYMNYLERSQGSGHEKPWHYYLSLIFWRKDGLVWTEALIGGLGIVGIIHAFWGNHRDGKRHRFLVFLSLYTLVLFSGYSFLAYKTPWSILTAQHSLTLLAGVGAAALWGVLDRGLANLAFQTAFGLGIYHLCTQTSLAINAYKADPRNPYVYAHTSTHLLQLIQTVRKLEALDPATPLTIQVINRDHGWPLPWYFRDLPTVGFQTSPPGRIDADIIIAEASQRASVMAAITAGDYRDTGLHGLRPGVPLIMLVKAPLWNALLADTPAASKTEPPPARTIDSPPSTQLPPTVPASESAQGRPDATPPVPPPVPAAATPPPPAALPESAPSPPPPENPSPSSSAGT